MWRIGDLRISFLFFDCVCDSVITQVTAFLISIYEPTHEHAHTHWEIPRNQVIPKLFAWCTTIRVDLLLTSVTPVLVVHFVLVYTIVTTVSVFMPSSLSPSLSHTHRKARSQLTILIKSSPKSHVVSHLLIQPSLQLLSLRSLTVSHTPTLSSMCSDTFSHRYLLIYAHTILGLRENSNC